MKITMLAAMVAAAAATRTATRSAPSYTNLRVTPPDTTDTVTVHPGIYGACHFQVHPVGSDM
ncbi:hypothetical protein [Mycobacterium sp.]|uniref:hypothetical protein n=1 Tax=Mycobacterium sp. TaxID=1785 RepID=UPI002C1EDA72|nr:hypothetical protein [Mycobacterium sp.]HTH84319.1 hypothetical protein [Mycobacterium sp.]